MFSLEALLQTRQSRKQIQLDPKSQNCPSLNLKKCGSAMKKTTQTQVSRGEDMVAPQWRPHWPSPSSNQSLSCVIKTCDLTHHYHSRCSVAADPCILLNRHWHESLKSNLYIHWEIKCVLSHKMTRKWNCYQGSFGV